MSKMTWEQEGRALAKERWAKRYGQKPATQQPVQPAATEGRAVPAPAPRTQESSQAVRPEAPAAVDDGYWTVEKVAVFLAMSVSWVYKRAEDGTLPVRRFGNQLRFKASEIRAWADSQDVRRLKPKRPDDLKTVRRLKPKRSDEGFAHILSFPFGN